MMHTYILILMKISNFCYYYFYIKFQYRPKNFYEALKRKNYSHFAKQCDSYVGTYVAIFLTRA